jgi:hypothetical protein
MHDTVAALANGCTMADLTWDWKHNFVEIFDHTLLIPRDIVEETG